MSKPSVLLVGNWDSSVGYAWWLMESFWIALADHYHGSHNIILTYPSVSRVSPEILRANIKIVQLQFGGACSPSRAMRDIAFLRKNRIRCIYFTDRKPTSFLYALYKFFGVRCIVVHDHAPGTRNRPTRIKSLAKWCLRRLPLVNADGLISPSEFVWRRHVDVVLMPKSKCFIVKNGIVPADNVKRYGLIEKLGLGADTMVVASVGRLSEVKNYAFGLRAIRRAIDQLGRRRIHYVIVGDGPLRDELSATINELNLNDSVTMLGKCANVRDLISECHIGFHPSKAEVGYSLATLELMDAGLPVIVPSNASVCGATIQDETGLIYEEGSIDSAASAIIMLVADPALRRRIGDNARLSVALEYSGNKTSQMLISSFDKIFEKEKAL